MKKTLDIQHNQRLTEFQSKKEELAHKKESLKDMEIKIKSLEGKNEYLDEFLNLLDNKYSLQEEIQCLENACNEIDYYTNTASILFKYYDIVEKGNDDQITTSKAKENSILKYFMPSPSVEETKPTQYDRATLLEKYMCVTDSNYIKSQEEYSREKCPVCQSLNRTVMIHDGMIICCDCDSVEFIIVDNERPSYREQPREVTYFSYKRINHLQECISQIQGKETTDIPEEIYDKILLEIKKQKITNMAVLNAKKIKEILKRLKANKYYEHIPHILNKLNGIPIPHFEPELEEKLRTMFKMIQPSFLKHSPPKRKNFLSYSYILHKLLQLLGKDEYLRNFNLLKSRDKLYQQDQIFKKICEDLGWEFIPSL
jgi:predicted esterase YcpF (UPF0227 family)